MTARWIERVIGSMEQKRRYRRNKARVDQLPAHYRGAVDALNRYMMRCGSITDGELIVSAMEDLADLFEESAANDTPIRAVLGEDPVEFVETFLSNYSEGHWLSTERERLVDAIDRVAEQQV